MTDEIKVKDHASYNAAVDRLDAAHAPLPEIAAETRRLAEEAKAGAAAATGSVAGSISAVLTALSGSMTASADAADAAHRQLRDTTLDMRTWNGGLKEIQTAGAENVWDTPTP